MGESRASAVRDKNRSKTAKYVYLVCTGLGAPRWDAKMDFDSDHTVDRARLGAALTRLRTQAGLSKEEAARRWGRDWRRLLAIEAGTRRIDVLSLRRLCSVYGATLAATLNEMGEGG